MKRYKFTLIGLLVAVMVLLYTFVFQIDLFEMVNSYMHELEDKEVDEFIIPLIIISLFSLLDIVKWRDQHKLEKLKIYEAMIASAHHILNNFLQKMELFNIKSKNSPQFNEKTIALYDQITNDALDQIHALSNVRELTEDSIISSLDNHQSNNESTNQGHTKTNADNLYR